MARMLVTLDGSTDSNGSPLLMHNERLADPLNPFSVELAKITGKRKKTEADHLEIALIEWHGCMYNDATDRWLAERPDVEDPIFASVVGEEVLVPYVPGWWVVRSIQEAAKRHKFGKLVIESVTPVTLKAPLVYDGPTELDQLWQDGNFALRKAVGVGQARTMRTRPVFVDWSLEIELEVDVSMIDPEKIDQFAQEAGRYKGIGDYRPLYGRFNGSAVLADRKKAKKEEVAA